MKYQTLYLQECFSVLQNLGTTAFVTAYLPDNMTEIGQKNKNVPVS